MSEQRPRRKNPKRYGRGNQETVKENSSEFQSQVDVWLREPENYSFMQSLWDVGNGTFIKPHLPQIRKFSKSSNDAFPWSIARTFRKIKEHEAQAKTERDIEDQFGAKGRRNPLLRLIRLQITFVKHILEGRNIREIEVGTRDRPILENTFDRIKKMASIEDYLTELQRELLELENNNGGDIEEEEEKVGKVEI